jgi:hypothetical protein
MRTPVTVAVAVVLLACASPGAARAHPPGSSARTGPYAVELVDQEGQHLPTFQQGGRTYALGGIGQRYLVRVRNGSPRRVEVVVSVDGRDVVDGQPSAWEKRGYLVEPWGEVTIDGFRLSTDAVAAFRFGSVARSYAARMGDGRDVGVIGVAVFPERAPAWTWRPPPRRQPGVEDGWDVGGSRGEAKGSAAPQASPDAAEAAPSARRDAARPGLGTEFGEPHGSPVLQVEFERASARPDALLTLRYDDRRGLLALGIDVDGRGGPDDTWLRGSAQPFRRDGTYAQPPPGWSGR